MSTELSPSPIPIEPDSGALAPQAAAMERTVIEPARGWRMVNLRELWRYRSLLKVLVWRDVKVRYKQTAIGAGWALLQPAAMMAVFTVFFGRMAQLPTDGVPYPLFVLAGLLPWMFFSNAITNAANSVVGAERLVTKIYFPRLVIPFSTIGAAFVDFVVALGLLLGLMVVYGYPLSASLLLAPLSMLCIALAATGIGTFLAALNVAYRDFRYVVPFMVQLWMFATPTIYMTVSREGRGPPPLWLAINPLAPLIASFRASMLGGEVDPVSVLLSGILALVMFVVGCLYFQSTERRFSDII